MQGFLDAVVKRHGRLDTLVNNAGAAPFAEAAAASPRFHAEVVELNLLSPPRVSQRANEITRKQDTGARRR